MGKEYLFTSERLGFRNWADDDVAPMAAINADPVVMEFFPGIKTYRETEEFIARMKKQYTEKAYCYFAVDKLDDGQFIGFIGLSEQTFEAGFTPCIDIGWRLSKKEWNKGYATESAQRCLDYAMAQLHMEKVVAVAPKVNTRSEQVMKKIGMNKVTEFIHPLLSADTRLRDCVLYEFSEKP